MTKSGREIKDRTVREWWVRGILPKPKRKRFGYGGGTETYWESNLVLNQAKAAFDLRDHSPRRVFNEDVLVKLWLIGFNIENAPLKSALLKRLWRQSLWLNNLTEDPEERILRTAHNVVQLDSKFAIAPTERKVALEQVFTALMEMYFRPYKENYLSDLRQLWRLAGPLLNIGENFKTDREFKYDHLEQISVWLEREASLPAQTRATATVTNHELTTIYRLIKVTRSICNDFLLNIPNEYHQDANVFFNLLLLELAPNLLPILVVWLKDLESCSILSKNLFEFSKITRSTEFSSQVYTFFNGIKGEPKGVNALTKLHRK